MAQVPLANGGVALVDEADLPIVSKYKWFADRTHKRVTYAYAMIDGKNVRMHRFLAGQGAPAMDHRNHDGLDNRRANMAPIGQSGNILNCRAHNDNQTGVKGVSFDGTRGKYVACLTVRGKKVLHKRFATMEDASNAYEEARKKMGV